jgi:signal transduction histidine kinase
VEPDSRLAQALHEGVAQRLAGVAAALGAAQELTPEARDRCVEELRLAIRELRAVIEGAAGAAGSQDEVEGLICDFVAEGIRNALKHAEPNVIAFSGYLADDRIRVEVVNDGVSDQPPGDGTHVGLELIGGEAIRRGGSVAAEPVEPDSWCTTLTLPRRRA